MFTQGFVFVFSSIRKQLMMRLVMMKKAIPSLLNNSVAGR